MTLVPFTCLIIYGSVTNVVLLHVVIAALLQALKRMWDRRASAPWGLPDVEYDDRLALLLLSDDTDQADEDVLEVEPPPPLKPHEEGSDFRQRYARLMSVARAIRVLAGREEMRAAGVELTTELAEDVEEEEAMEEEEYGELSEEEVSPAQTELLC